MNHKIIKICRMISYVRSEVIESSTKMKSKNHIFDICDDKSLSLASSCLKQGQVIALPTDTVYGLACNANCSQAIQKLYSIKRRDINKPVAICVANLKSLRYWGEANHLSDEILQKLLPGPFTIVLYKTINLNECLNQGMNKIGIRIPKFKFIQDLCEHFNQPLALTSANKSNEPSCLSIEEFENLWPHLAAVFNAGKISLNDENRVGSTIIDLSVPDKCKFIRKGVAYFKALDVMKEYNIQIV